MCCRPNFMATHNPAAIVVTPHARSDVLRLPDFPNKILNETWEKNRANAGKLNTAAYSVRCTLTAMCGMDVHKRKCMKKHDIWSCCKRTYIALVASMARKHPNAKVVEFVGHTALTKLAPMSGEKVFRMSQMVRKHCVNQFNPLWKSCLGPTGQPPSGKDWEWVRQRVLIMLYRQAKKDITPLEANAGLCGHSSVFVVVVVFVCICFVLLSFLFFRFGSRARGHPGGEAFLGAWTTTRMAHVHGIWPWSEMFRPKRRGPRLDDLCSTPKGSQKRGPQTATCE